MQHIVANVTGANGVPEPTCYDPNITVSTPVPDDYGAGVRCYSPSGTFAYSYCPDDSRGKVTQEEDPLLPLTSFNRFVGIFFALHEVFLVTKSSDFGTSSLSLT